MATRLIAPTRETSAELSQKRLMLVAVAAMVAAVAVMFVGASLGAFYAAVAVLGVLVVVLVVVQPLFGVVAFIGTLLLGLPGFLAGEGRLSATNLLGLVLLAMLMVHVCMRRDLWFLRSPQVLLLLAIAAAFVISFLHARHVYIPTIPPSKDFTENTLFIIGSRLLFLVMFVNFVRTRRALLLVLLSVLVYTMAVIPGALHEAATFDAQVDVATGKLIDPDTGKATEFRVSSDVSSWGKNANRLAFLCNTSILLIWMFSQIWRSAVARFAGFLMMLMLAALTLSTGSRSGFISLGIVFLFLLLQRGVPRSFRVGVAGAIAVCALIFFLALPQAAYERLLSFGTDQTERGEGWRSTQSRIETNEHAIETIRRAPLLGVGPGNFRWYHREHWPYALSAGRPNHNSYLWAATEGGFLTLGLYLVLFWFIWRDLQTAQRRYPPGHPLWHTTRFVRGLMGLFIFFSAFADFWLEPHLYLLAGMSMLLARRDLEEPEAAPEQAPALEAREVPA
jgi:hypothetical protein